MKSTFVISLLAASLTLLPGCSTFETHQEMVDRVSQLEVDFEHLLQTTLPKARAYGGGAIFVTPGFANCTAKCRRDNCRAKVGREWINCAVACDISCRR